jgi:hypothetical protein
VRLDEDCEFIFGFDRSKQDLSYFIEFMRIENFWYKKVRTEVETAVGNSMEDFAACSYVAGNYPAHSEE